MSLIGTYFRVTAAMIVREMATRFGRKPGGYVWALLEPVAYISILTVVFGAVARTPVLGSSFILFFATGFLGYQLYQSRVGYISTAIRANRALFSYPNVAPIDAVTARFILQTFTTALVATIVFSGIFLTLKQAPTVNWMRIIEAEVFAGSLAVGVGLFNSVMFVKSPLYEQAYGIVTRPLMMLSGVFFIPDNLPIHYRDILMYNPVCHIIMLFRSAFYPEYRASGLDLQYLTWVSATAIFIGMLVFTMSNKIVREG